MSDAISHAINTAVGDQQVHLGDAAASDASPPTNQQIISAAQAAYSRFQVAVDSQTMALVDLISEGSMTTAVLAIDAVDWQASQVSSQVVDPFYSSDGVQEAMTAAANANLASFSVGVFTKAGPGGAVGTVGFDRDVGRATPPPWAPH